MLFRLKLTLALVYYNVVEKITVMKRATARSRPFSSLPAAAACHHRIELPLAPSSLCLLRCCPQECQSTSFTALIIAGCIPALFSNSKRFFMTNVSFHDFRRISSVGWVKKCLTRAWMWINWISPPIHLSIWQPSMAIFPLSRHCCISGPKSLSRYNFNYT